MKINQKLIALFSVLMVVTIGITSYLAIQSIESSVIASGIQEMNNTLSEKAHHLQMLDDKASEDLVFALKNPVFVQYFELPETKAGDVYENGVLQFTDKQREIKTQIDQWMFHFQDKFQVDETCLVDTSGQDHARIVLEKIQSDENLMSNEKLSPFFKSSFEKNNDEVYIQYPYVSMDTNRWVFAYTSPVVLGDGEKPAFYHFEMPMYIFQDEINIETGRMYVVDPEGYLIADSQYSFPTHDISPNPRNYFPAVSTVSTSPEFNNLVQKMKNEENGVGKYSKNGESYYVVYKKLPTFGWSIAYERPYSLMLNGSVTLYDLETTIAIVASAMIAGGLVGVILVSNRISLPIIKLRDATNEVAKGNFDIRTNIKTSDEIGQLSSAFDSMAMTIQESLMAIRQREVVIKQQHSILLQFSEQSENYFICIVDIIGSTKITAKLSDLESSKLYDIFLNSIAVIVRDFDGMVVKNVGDSLLFYFPKTNSQYNDAVKNALECCLTIGDFHYQLNKKLEHEALPPIDYKISATYGSVRVAKIATSTIDDIFGSTVNKCAKINQLAPPNGLVIDDSLYQIIKSFDTYAFKIINEQSAANEFGHVYLVTRK